MPKTTAFKAVVVGGGVPRGKKRGAWGEALRTGTFFAAITWGDEEERGLFGLVVVDRIRLYG